MGRRLLLAFMGVALALAAIETAMWAAAAALETSQDRTRNDLREQPEALRILCLGESTTSPTAGPRGDDISWPAQLAELLRRRYPDRRFQVINKGYGSTNSGAIASSLPDYLDRFDPQLVVSMIGVNDLEWYGVARAPEGLRGGLKILLSRSRAWRLARYIYFESAIGALGGAGPAVARRDVWKSWLQASADQRSGRMRKAETELKALIRAAPDWNAPYDNLFTTYAVEREFAKASAVMEGALRLDPDYREKPLTLGFPSTRGETDAVTAENYRTISQAVRSRSIPLFAMQYPTKDPAGLARMLGENEGVAIIDNSGIFKERLRGARYEDLFVDRFAGTWGHCTSLGNRLIAENVLRRLAQAPEFRRWLDRRVRTASGS